MKKTLVVKVDGKEIGRVTTTRDYKFALVRKVSKEEADSWVANYPSWSKNEYKKWKQAAASGYYIVSYSSRKDLLENSRLAGFIVDDISVLEKGAAR